MNDYIYIKGAREHNLKNIDVKIPKKKFVVITGLSGSGKSTLAFDILFKEGQRQFIESMGRVTDYLHKPKIESIQGLSPSISVGQHRSNQNPRSTVGTFTEIYTYMRVLYARIGYRPCPHCGKTIPPSYIIEMDEPLPHEYIVEDENDKEEENDHTCPFCKAKIMRMGMAHFSFNTLVGACPTCTGLGSVFSVNLDRLVRRDLSILDGAIETWNRPDIDRWQLTLRSAGKYYGFHFNPALPVKDLGQMQKDLLFYGVYHPQFRRHFPDRVPPVKSSQGRFEGVIPHMMRRYKEHINNNVYLDKIKEYFSYQECFECNGERIRKESRKVRVADYTITELSKMPLSGLYDWIVNLPKKIKPKETIVAEPVIADLEGRIKRLVDVGVGYLTMNRPAATLSAGENQRLRLAALLGSGLTDVLYILDEPTIGLHARDTDKLIKVLRKLKDTGNSVLVIEHDLDVIKAADYVIDMGPGAGKHGGEIIACGKKEEFLRSGKSYTAEYLSSTREIPVPAKRRPVNKKFLKISGARANNLKNINVHIPLGIFVAVTGVSGSGKSSLVLNILERAANQYFNHAQEKPDDHDSIEGWEHISKVISIDQSPIGRTPRSNAATYTDIFSTIRKIFAEQESAVQKQLTMGNFSFNVKGGRCEYCSGAGVVTVNMHFLPDIEVRCPVCKGRRFKKKILDITYRGYNIANILDMTVDEAYELFKDISPLEKRLKVLIDIGLGYLQLGQPATTLSGGEAQRVKLAKELGRKSTDHTLYLLDEPTSGLHIHDVTKLLSVLQQLINTGNSVLIIEHNIDIIKSADWIIDLGPESGEAGGHIIAHGPPEEIIKNKESYTGKFLRSLI